MTEGISGTGTAKYEIIVKGHLDERWASRLGQLQITPLPGGRTELAGPVVDQPALHGILSRIRDLGLVLISVRRLEPSDNHEPAAADGGERERCAAPQA